MKRYLVVANQTLGGEHLLAELRQRVSEGACSIHVLVPSSCDPTAWSHTEEEDDARAHQRLESALQRFGALGCEVTGEVAGPRTVDDIGDALRVADYDEVILSTLPPGVSRWLRMDLPRRVERAFDVPVTHVVAAYEPVG
jgi:hypothetical protein